MALIEPAPSETLRRRGLLASRPNPREDLDYVVRLTLRHAAARAAIEIWYVPDRLIVEPSALPAYVAALAGLGGLPLEELALTVLEDVSDELVPRWTRIAVTRQAAGGGVGPHVVMLEDRQPMWNNQDLLTRLNAY